MSKFVETYRKRHFENNGKYDSAWEYHKALMKNFKGWQPPKPLVEVPKCVADFIEDEKGKLKIFGAFREISQKHGGSELYRWVFGSADSQELFAKAWLDGYTVKKEQLYVIKYPMTLNPYVLCTGKNEDNEIIISGHTSVKKYAKRFTEQEIKSIDERYWAFAVKVEG